MATASEAAAIATEASWRARVEYYRLAAAIDIVAEDSLTPNHAERVTYAQAVIAGSEDITEYALAVATNDTIRVAMDVSVGAPDWDVQDGDMEFTVNSLVDAFAGVAT